MSSAESNLTLSMLYVEITGSTVMALEPQGGVIHASTNARINLTSCRISNSSVVATDARKTSVGGVVYASDNASITVLKSTFSSSHATSGGVFWLGKFASFTARLSVFEDSSAMDTVGSYKQKPYLQKGGGAAVFAGLGTLACAVQSCM